MFGGHHILNKMAAMVTVADVCTPILCRFPPTLTASEAYCRWQQEASDRVPRGPLDYVSLVVDDEKLVGWLDFANLVNPEDGSRLIAEFIEPLNEANLITSNTPLLDAATFFGPESSCGFGVVRNREMIGFLAYQDLISTPFRACLFSWLLAVEELLEQILATNIKAVLGKFSARKIERVKERCKSKSTTPANHEILRKTFFSEKINLLKLCPRSVTLFPAIQEETFNFRLNLLIEESVPRTRPTGRKVPRTEQLTNIRNALAHSSDSAPVRLMNALPKDDLKSFMNWLKAFESQMVNFLDNGRKLPSD